MTHEEVKALVEEMGLPYAYDHFAEGESPNPVSYTHLDDSWDEEEDDWGEEEDYEDEEDY